MTNGKDQPHAKGKILVVDDEEPVGRLLQDWLLHEGYQVGRATGFDQVRALMETESYDLVTLDIMMPGVDGLQVLAWIKEQYPDVGVVMATAMGDLDTVLTAMRGGAVNYLVKPFRLDLVSEEIARAMERQRLIAENRAYQEKLEEKVEAQTRELRIAHSRLQQQVKELEGRDRLVRCQISGTSLAQAREEIVQVVSQVLEAAPVALYEPQADGDALAVVAAEGTRVAAAPGGPLADEDALAARAYRERQPKSGAEGQAAVPLVYQEEALAVLWVGGLREADRDEACNILWRLGQEAALVLWSARVAEDLASGQMEIDELLDLDGGNP